MEHTGTRSPGRSGYVGGCRCEECCTGNATYMVEYRKRYAISIREVDRKKKARWRAENPDANRERNRIDHATHRARKRST